MRASRSPEGYGPSRSSTGFKHCSSRPNLAHLKLTAEALRDDPDQLHTSLTALLRDGARLADVAARSYVHPNGFAKVVMHVGGGYGIRLHVWRREHRTRADDANPHGHRGEFASWVVAGTLHETTFIEASDSERYDRSNYGRHVNGMPYLHVAGTASLRRLEEIDRVAGTVYARSRSVLHYQRPDKPQLDHLVQ